MLPFEAAIKKEDVARCSHAKNGLLNGVQIVVLRSDDGDGGGGGKSLQFANAPLSLSSFR